MVQRNRIMLFGLLAVAVLLILLPRLAPRGEAGPAITPNPAAALATAKSAGQPVLLEFYGDG